MEVLEQNAILALDGGPATRTAPMPARKAIGPNERAMINEALDYYDTIGQDPGYQGIYEARYTQDFCRFMGGGFADVVSTGTLSLYVAIAALELPPSSEILVSPITDPGMLNAIIALGHRPKLVDSEPFSFNVEPDELKRRISEDTQCLVLVHATGKACSIDAISQICKENNIKLLEDCSQAHGAMFKGRKVGSFGDIAAFSTMYRKNSITGSSGGVIYTTSELLYQKVLAYADRGKPVWQENFDARNPKQFLFPALNCHSNEISCAIGIASLKRLEETIHNRIRFLQAVEKGLESSFVCRPTHCSSDDSPFIFPIFVDPKQITCSKREFAEAVRAEGIGLNPHYDYLVRDWPYLEKYLVDSYDTPNARETLDRCFCLYVNEKYGQQEITDTLAAIAKVEKYYRK